MIISQVSYRTNGPLVLPVAIKSDQIRTVQVGNDQEKAQS